MEKISRFFRNYSWWFFWYCSNSWATSDSAIAYSEVSSPAILIGSGSGQANCTLDSSTGVIATTDFGGSSTTPTLYTFTLRATDAEGQTADRVFTLQSSFGATGGALFA